MTDNRSMGPPRRFARAVAVAIWLGVVVAAARGATPPDAAQMPEALQGVKKAGGMCMRDKSRVATEATDEPARTPPDLRCAIEPPDLAARLGRPEVVLVDVRQASQYVATHIEGAMNLSAGSLVTKTHLKDKTVVLVGDGKSEAELYSACADLRRNGFPKAAVLRGGVVAWISQGHPVQGQGRPVLQDSSLTPSELWAESEFDANVVLVTPDRGDMLVAISSSFGIDEATSPAIRRALDRRRRELKGQPVASVILVSGAAADEAVVQRLRAELQPLPVLVYSETLDSYKRANAQQVAIWRARARGPKQPACGR